MDQATTDQPSAGVGLTFDFRDRAKTGMNAMSEAIGSAPESAPSPDEIRAALDHILFSEVFRRSPQLGAFLRFVTEAVLHGKGDRIKAYTIGVEVLRRDPTFDPQIDPIVRVEATRLRRAMERYYSGPGQDDPIVIEMPRGSYVPAFRRREFATPAIPAATGVPWPAWFRQAPMFASLLAVVAIVAVAAVASGFYFGRSGDTTASTVGPARDGEARKSAGGLPTGNGMPVVRIEPIKVIGTPLFHEVNRKSVV